VVWWGAELIIGDQPAVHLELALNGFPGRIEVMVCHQVCRGDAQVLLQALPDLGCGQEVHGLAVGLAMLQGDSDALARG
jgi:hypothetical protein